MSSRRLVGMLASIPSLLVLEEPDDETPFEGASAAGSGAIRPALDPFPILAEGAAAASTTR